MPKPLASAGCDNTLRKMVRTSSSMDRPFAAAAKRSLSLMSVSMLRMVKVDMGLLLWVWQQR
jgi:hypothetical protein